MRDVQSVKTCGYSTAVSSFRSVVSKVDVGGVSGWREVDVFCSLLRSCVWIRMVETAGWFGCGVKGFLTWLSGVGVRKSGT